MSNYKTMKTQIELLEKEISGRKLKYDLKNRK